MQQYLDILQQLVDKGHASDDRTGTGTFKLFGAQMRFDMADGFPLLTTKKVFMKGITHELLWFLNGDTNIKYLNDNNVHIWDEWADKNGDLGPVYGKQWRSWDVVNGPAVDQLQDAIHRIKTNPNDRRIIVSAWNVGDLDKMALPPCHCFFQLQVDDGRLHLQLYQRSCDWFLGVPFNIASYALLLHMIAKITHLTPGEFIHTSGDLHLYANHVEQAKEQLSRQPGKLPTLVLHGAQKEIDDFLYDDIEVVGYEPAATIKAPISV